MTVLGKKLLGLLDSGATNTVLGKPGWDTIQQLGFELCTTDARCCTVANGARTEIIGSVLLPLRLMDKIKLINVFVIPELEHTLILGHDFWVCMKIIPDLYRDEWHFSKSPISQNGIAEMVVSKSDLTKQQREILDKFIQDKFEMMKTSLGCTHLVEHEIITDSSPIKQRYYPVSPVVQRYIDEELRKMLELDIIERSNSSWSSPVILVPKKEGGYRFCVDFRKLNSVTKKDAYPIPYVSSILDRLKGARYLSSIDIKSAYWQVPMKESSREFTAFTIPGRGLYHFKRMPFGLCNAPAVWQRLMDKVIGADLEPFAFVYLDDVIILSSTFEQHLELLEKIFRRLYDAGLTINKDKCHFCKPELRYLGYVVDKNGLRVDPEKVQAILKIPTPTSVKEVRSFIGMASWYRRFVPHFSSVIAPLCNLLRKRNKWTWTSECDQAFKIVKENLITAPLLHSPDFTKPFIVQTDASAFGLGAVLSQQFSDGERVICYLSRSLTKQERQYSTTERECLAVLWALERLRPYLEGSPFTVITDHHSLIWLNNLKDPCGRLCRWAVRLQQYNFSIIHRRGKEHVVPDLLSRSVPILDAVSIPSIQPDFDCSKTNDNWYLKLREKIIRDPILYRQWRVQNNVIYKYVQGSPPELTDEEDHWKIVIPKEHRQFLLNKEHSQPTSAHPGVFKTYQRLRQKFYWPKMKSDVIKFVKRCKTCIAYKVVQDKPCGLMGTRPVISKPFQLISVDIVGPLPRSSKGYLYILVVCDYFSKFVLTFPLRAASAKIISQHIENDVFLLFGVPQFLVSDNGTQFRSVEFKNLCQKYNTTILYTALYHPQSNPTERTNRVIKTMLAVHVQENHRKWDVFLSPVTCAIRTLVHEVTGHTPYFILFGREHVIDGKRFAPVNVADKNLTYDRSEERIDRRSGFEKLFTEVKEKLKSAYEKYSRQYNLRRRHVEYHIGDEVWRRNYALSSKTDYFAAKLSPKYIGPFRVKKKTGYCTYEIVDETGKSSGIWHVKDLRAGPPEN